MFWKRNKDESRKEIEVPKLDELELWVPSFIANLELESGTFTILPCFGGILLFIRDEGITWIPYKEIQEALGTISKAQLAENSALLGGVAIVAATGGTVLPIILAHGLLKGTYRIFTKPPPAISLAFLKSTISEIRIKEDTTLSTRILEKFENSPIKEKEKSTKIFKIILFRKFLDNPDAKKSRSHQLLSNIKSFVTRTLDAEFTAPSEINILEFQKILSKHGIKVRYVPSSKGDAETSMETDN